MANMMNCYVYFVYVNFHGLLVIVSILIIGKLVLEHGIGFLNMRCWVERSLHVMYSW